MPLNIPVTSLNNAAECPLCLWLSLKGLSPPALPLPGVLSRIDAIVKEYMQKFTGGKDLPKWFPVKGNFLGEKWLRATDEETGITVNGKLDALVEGEDGKYHIVDYKTATAKAETPGYYQWQMDGYAYLLSKNHLVPIGKGYLIYFMPVEGNLSTQTFTFQITSVEVEVDPGRVPPLLKKIREIVESDIPPRPAERCQMCMWRRKLSEAEFGFL
ncbi:MAG: PD-(D/E)XK nuclease family protein [Candidatus Hadarchaeales archaeon]